MNPAQIRLGLDDGGGDGGEVQKNSHVQKNFRDIKILSWKVAWQSRELAASHPPII